MGAARPGVSRLFRPRGRIVLAILTSLAAAACSELATDPRDAVVDAPVGAAKVIADRFAAARPGCVEGAFPTTGALLEVCFPTTWNGGVVYWAHGYKADGQPLAIPNDALGGLAVADIVRGLGYIYAASSYRDNGLVAADAALDMEDLAFVVQSASPVLAAAPSYLVGASEGGIAAALAIQNPSTRFDGALSMCGPVGNFGAQINYMGDFRLVFDYFFPGVLPGAPLDPAALAALRPNWDTVWEPAIRAAIAADRAAGGSLTQQLFTVTNAQVDPSDPGQTAADLLWYNVFGTGDAIAKLGGQPFDNTTRFYSGSSNDTQLNAAIPRFTGSANPAELARYETNGQVERPTVALHTAGDHIIPYWHETLLRFKAQGTGDIGRLYTIGPNRYGHCQFTVLEVLLSVALLTSRVQSAPLVVSTALFADQAEQDELLRQAAVRGLKLSVRDADFIGAAPRRRPVAR